MALADVGADALPRDEPPHHALELLGLHDAAQAPLPLDLLDVAAAEQRGRARA